MLRQFRVLFVLALLCSALPLASFAWTAGSHGIIENRGQLDEQVRYYAYCDGGVILYFTDTAVVLDLSEERHAIWMFFEGASTPARIEAFETSDAKLHFFLGDDPGRWRSNVPVHGELVYRDLWPGIDLRFRPVSGGLRYEIAARPGADPDIARFRYAGVDDRIAASDGSVRLEITSRTLVDAPEAGGPAHILCWDGGRRGDGWQGRPDPGTDSPSTILWSTLIGAYMWDRSHGLTLDSANNPLICGYTFSASFPTTEGAYDTTLAGSYDVFVAKFDATGSTLIWSTLMGGLEEDRAFAIDLDDAENPVIAGLAQSLDFPTTEQAFDRTLGGGQDAFVAKLDKTGSALLWSTFMGGESLDRSWDMVLDEDERPVVAGESYSSDFPTTPDAYSPEHNGNRDGFVMKFNSVGTDLVWSTYLGGSVDDRTMWIVLSPDQEPVVCGNTASADFPTTPGSVDETLNGGQDCYVAKLDPSGATLVYSTLLGGVEDDWGHVLAMDPSGGVVVTGHTFSEDFPVTVGAFDTEHNGPSDVFVTRLDSGATSLVWSTFLGGSSEEEAFAFVLDHENRPVISGETHSIDFPTTPNGFDTSQNGDADAYLARLDVTGSELVWGSFVGGVGLDGGWELFIHPSGEPMLTGPTWSEDFPTTEGAFDETYNGTVDAFLLRFNIEGVSSVEGEELRGAPRLWTGPNPFSDAIGVRLDLPQPGEVKLLVFDAAGRRVATVLRGYSTEGEHWIGWNGRDARGRQVASGAYWLRLVADRTLAQQKVVVVR